MKRIYLLPLGALVLLASCSASFYFGVQFERSARGNTRQHADPIFTEGFEKGVRYGLLVQAAYPTEGSLLTLTNSAKMWFWLAEIKAKEQRE